MKAAEAELRGVLEVVHEGGALRDALDGFDDAFVAFTEHREIVYANAAAEQFFGYERHALEGLSTDALLPERLRQPQAPKMTPSPDLVSVKLAGLRRDGSELSVEWLFGSTDTRSGLLFVMVLRDPEKLRAAELERRLAEERARREDAEAAERRIRASETRLLKLQQVTVALTRATTPLDVASVILEQSLEALEASAGAIYLVDGDQLRFLDQRGHPTEPLSSFATLPLALPAPLADAVRDKTPSFYGTFEECAARYPAFRGAIASGNFEASVALPLLTHSTPLGVLGIRFAAPRVFGENDRALLLTLADLCAQALDRARLLAAERDARQAAEAANRAKDDFLAMLGHELRNPLAPIVTALSVIRAKNETAFARERTIIERQVAHLATLVDDLLDIFRITRGSIVLKKQQIELASVVAKALELSSTVLETQRHHLAVSVPEEGLLVDGDPTRLAQVVGNLLMNAGKYTHPGGHIEVRAARSGERIVLAVEDDGIGIAESLLPRIFDPFVQARQDIDRQKGGLGLGLSIVKKIVDLHGGTVSVASHGEGKGSTFEVTFPLSPTTPAAPRSPSVKPVHVKRRVLVVDDNTDAAEMLSDWLMGFGHDVATAHDGPTALDLVSRFSPDVVLLDIGLPVMDGFDVARRMLDLHLARPPLLVAVTGYGQAADRARSAREGFRAHLVKPVDLDVLASLLSTAPTSGVSETAE
jgi:PAS domain S-box-containing protein